MSFASESAEKNAGAEEVVDEKILLPVGTLPCHAGGRGFESRRSRQIFHLELNVHMAWIPPPADWSYRSVNAKFTIWLPKPRLQ